MKIACNSAYIQTETLNFIFIRQAVIVYFYICPDILNAHVYCCYDNTCFYNLLQWSQNIGNAVTFVFAYFS